VKPLDPRLLRHARSARGYLALTVALGVVTAALVVAQALLLGGAVGRAVHDGATLRTLAPTAGWLVLVVLARAAATTVQERFAHRAATRAVAELRAGLVEHAVALGPRWLATGRGPEVVTLATRGLDALEPYFVRYLPQLVLSATVTPATILVVLGLDWVSAAIVVGTLPLIPIFMVLIGRMTEGRSERGLASMARLGSQVLDLVAGLPTLRAFGREAGPATRVRALGDAHRRATMGTLRIAFLSGMVLELLTTLSVALVAVSIGLRLVYGGLSLTTGLTVLILAPEVYWPLRQVGAQFHASTDGVAAADAAFAVLETPVPAAGTVPCPPLAGATLRLAGVTVRSSGGETPHRLDLSVAPGRVTALVGPSGVGKTTTVEVLLGLLRPDEGTAVVERPGAAPVALADLDPATFWPQVAWLPQRPVLEPGTVRSLVGGASDDERAAAAARTGLDGVLAELPSGWDTSLGAGGAGLSVGQRQRVALTRALLSPAPLVVLDEPTAHLDAAGEAVVLDTVEALRAAGRTVLLVAHRPSLVATADAVVTVAAAPAEAAPSEAAPSEAADARSVAAAAPGDADAPVSADADAPPDADIPTSEPVG
jgi:ATP-binding cassette subfamily C protein CydD